MCIADAAGGPVYFEVSAGGPDDRVSKISEELELSPFEFSPGGPGFNFPGLLSY